MLRREDINRINTLTGERDHVLGTLKVLDDNEHKKKTEFEITIPGEDRYRCIGTFKLSRPIILHHLNERLARINLELLSLGVEA